MISSDHGSWQNTDLLKLGCPHETQIYSSLAAVSQKKVGYLQEHLLTYYWGGSKVACLFREVSGFTNGIVTEFSFFPSSSEVLLDQDHFMTCWL